MIKFKVQIEERPDGLNIKMSEPMKRNAKKKEEDLCVFLKATLQQTLSDVFKGQQGGRVK